MTCKYPHRVTIQMTDDMFKQIKQSLNIRHLMGDLSAVEPDILLLHIVGSIDEGRTGPIFLKSVKESEKEEKK